MNRLALTTLALELTACNIDQNLSSVNTSNSSIETDETANNIFNTVTAFIGDDYANEEKMFEY